jgi:GABA(A) receptor-associated protein
MLNCLRKKESSDFEIKTAATLQERINFSEKIRFKYPDRVPVIIKKNVNDKILQDIDKERYLIPKNLNLSEIIYIIRKRIKLDSKQAIFLFVGKGVLVPLSQTINVIYEDYKSEDGFLYMVYTTENTFG